jgi:hypothetical protein
MPRSAPPFVHALRSAFALLVLGLGHDVRAAAAWSAATSTAVAWTAVWTHSRARPRAVASDEIVAQALDSVLSAEELEDLLVIRRASSEDGRAALRHLAKSRLLEKLGHEFGLVLPDADLERRVKAADDEARKGGAPDGLAGHLKRARLTREQFKHFLWLAYVQETLTRRALALDDKKPVTADQQEIWIEEELAKRAFQTYPPPWKDGVVARASDFTIAPGEFLDYLRGRLPAETLREDCYQLLLQKRMLARMPDLAPEKLEKAVDEEVQRRRDEVRLDPKNKGVPLEQLLGAQGILVERLGDDPAVRISALSKLWVERSYDDKNLKQVYETERELFDGLYGPAQEVALLFLRAAKYKNDLNPRTFEEAEKELATFAQRARSREEFRDLAKSRSEDAESKPAAGELGWVGPLTPKVPREIREEVVRRLALPEAQASGLVGPLRLANGSCLLWIGRRRPRPSWDVMSGYVRAELRRRFVEDVLPRAAVVTVFE